MSGDYLVSNISFQKFSDGVFNAMMGVLAGLLNQFFKSADLAMFRTMQYVAELRSRATGANKLIATRGAHQRNLKRFRHLPAIPSFY
jgi:hypothetical protein